VVPLHHVPSYGASPIFIKESDDFSHGLNERTAGFETSRRRSLIICQLFADLSR